MDGIIQKSEIQKFVEENINQFHARRLEHIKAIKLSRVLARKNPYLFKAKNILTTQDLVRCILDSYLSSQEETIFGTFLEQLAIFVAGKVFGGSKSSTEGIDLEFEKEGVKYLVAIKSGPNWGNSSQIKRMIDNFKKAKRTLNTNRSPQKVICVNGCCYGQSKTQDKGEYLKLCGQDFWEFISSDSEFYLKIIEPLGFKAKEKNETFNLEYSKCLNVFTQEFTNQFCDTTGMILWDKIVKLNSEHI